jgi:glycosyltransferase involved in cell wall biosynthesis
MTIDTVAATSPYISRAPGQRTGRSGASVLHVVRRLDHSGEARLAIEFAAALNDVGGQAAIVYDSGMLPPELQRHGIPAVEIKLGSRAPFSGAAAAKRLAKLLGESPIDIIHVHGLDLLPVVRAALGDGAAKLVLGMNADLELLAKLPKRLRQALERVDEIVVLSRLTGHELADAMPALADRISLVEFGVDLTRFDPAQVTAHRVIQMAQQWRVPDDRPVVMLPGRFARERGHGTLVEALGLIRDVDLRCILVGPDADGPAFRKELGKEIAQLGLGDRVLLTEECRDMPAALMLADVVVAPYHAPGAHNRAIIEAMALGRPVVASDFPVSRELLEGNDMAWLAPAGDAMALSWAIREALALPADHREILSQRVIETLRDQRSRTRMCGAALDIYERLRPTAAAAA